MPSETEAILRDLKRATLIFQARTIAAIINQEPPMNLPGYDEWKTRTPDDDRAEIGTEEGQICGRCEEPDEDNPKPRPCQGAMIEDAGEIACDTCGEIA